MKELQQHLKHHERIEIANQQQKEQQKLLIGKIVPKAGQRIWQINIETLEVSEPRYNNHALKYELALNRDFARVADIIMMEGCVYIPAINKENAFKKFKKNPNQSHYFYKEPPTKLGDHFAE